MDSAKPRTKHITEEEENDLVPVADFAQPWEANIFQGRLQAEGMFAVVTGDELFAKGIAANIQVQVRRKDAERATEIKRRCDQAADEDGGT